jgi:acetyl esterase
MSTNASAKGTEIVLDPMIRAVVDAVGDDFAIDLEAMPLDEALRRARPPGNPNPKPPNSADLTIAGSDGAKIRIRLYYPNTRTANLPVLLHLHGGGFVAGTIEQDDARCASLANEVNCIVASVDYRLAPEHIFPAAIEDAFSAWNWVTNEAATFGGDSRRCAISGSSAGGHIAVGAALLARARGVTMPLIQLLAYPVIDPRLNTVSYHDFAGGPFMTKIRMSWYWKQYAGNAALGGELWNPLTAPAAGLPPAYIITAEYDVLRDEGEAYGAHLRAAGIEATAERFAHMIHGFLSMVPSHEASKTALRNSAAALRNAFAKSRGRREQS